MKVGLRQKEKRKDMLDKSELFLTPEGKSFKKLLMLYWHIFCLEETNLIRKTKLNRKF